MGNKLQEFIDEAMSHKGQNAEWVYDYCEFLGLGRGYAWCAAFVTAVSIKTGVINKIIFPTASADYILYCTTDKNSLPYPGQYIPGPYFGNIVVPMSGDLIFYKWGGKAYAYDMDNDHVGIVRYADNGVVYSIEGNVTFNGVAHMCNTVEHSIYDSRICAYARPNWAVVGGSYEGLRVGNLNQSTSAIGSSSPSGSPSAHSTSSYSSTSKPQQTSSQQYAQQYVQQVEEVKSEPATLVSKSLYESTSFAEDAILREVGYLSTSGTKNLYSGLKLSVINYTNALSALIRANDSAVYSVEEGSFDTDLLKRPMDKVVLRYLFDKGFNAPQAIGIYSVIYKISECNASFVSTDKTKYGILGWSKSGISMVIQYCGRGWNNNITGQMDYFWTDMCIHHKSFITSMENEVLENKKSYLKKSIELTINEYASSYPKSFFDSCYLVAQQAWEILQGN